MACITRIIGYGCNTQGFSNGIIYDLTYVGQLTLAVNPALPFTTGPLSPRYPNGSFAFPDAFASVISLAYEGCNPDPAQPHDCINGGCVPKTTYGTPGVFPNLASCQSGCAKNSNCTGECVPPEEIAALQQAANNLRAKFCG